MSTTAQAATKVHYIAISQYSWGRGDTIEGAKKQLKLAGGNLKTYYVQRCEQPADAANPYVDSYGATVWTPVKSGIPLVTVEAKKLGKSVDTTGGAK